MSPLKETLDALFSFLTRWGLTVPSLDIRIFETPKKRELDAEGRLILRREELHLPDDYEKRFEELTHSGRPWVNVSCCGIEGGKLLVRVEFPEPTGSSRTSVNLSGPSNAVRWKEWDANAVLVVR